MTRISDAISGAVTDPQIRDWLKTLSSKQGEPAAVAAAAKSR
jgi:hypothetical protein